MTTSPRERPARMMRNGRPDEQHFGADELMYRRYVEDDFEAGYLRPARFPFPPSLNRQLFSEPEDVIFSETGEYDEYGVLECSAAELSPRIVDDHQIEFVFIPIHSPEENNYSHSEIWADCIPKGKRVAEPSKITKKLYRTMISERFRIRIKSKK